MRESERERERERFRGYNPPLTRASWNGTGTGQNGTGSGRRVGGGDGGTGRTRGSESFGRLVEILFPDWRVCIVDLILENAEEPWIEIERINERNCLYSSTEFKNGFSMKLCTEFKNGVNYGFSMKLCGNRTLGSG